MYILNGKIKALLCSKKKIFVKINRKNNLPGLIVKGKGYVRFPGLIFLEDAFTLGKVKNS